MVKKCRWLKHIDMFGFPVDLNFDEKGSTHQTVCGSVATLVFVVISLAMVAASLASGNSTMLAQNLEMVDEIDDDQDIRPLVYFLYAENESGQSVNVWSSFMNYGQVVASGNDLKPCTDDEIMQADLGTLTSSAVTVSHMLCLSSTEVLSAPNQTASIKVTLCDPSNDGQCANYLTNTLSGIEFVIGVTQQEIVLQRGLQTLTSVPIEVARFSLASGQKTVSSSIVRHASLDGKAFHQATSGFTSVVSKTSGQVAFEHRMKLSHLKSEFT